MGTRLNSDRSRPTQGRSDPGSGSGRLRHLVGQLSADARIDCNAGWSGALIFALPVLALIRPLWERVEERGRESYPIFRRNFAIVLTGVLVLTTIKAV